MDTCVLRRPAANHLHSVLSEIRWIENELLGMGEEEDEKEAKKVEDEEEEEEELRGNAAGSIERMRVFRYYLAVNREEQGLAG
ncbi:hypothetical protein V1478_013032, partial [Vespula squamosa]